MGGSCGLLKSSTLCFQEPEGSTSLLLQLRESARRCSCRPNPPAPRPAAARPAARPHHAPTTPPTTPQPGPPPARPRHAPRPRPTPPPRPHHAPPRPRPTPRPTPHHAPAPPGHAPARPGHATPRPPPCRRPAPDPADSLPDPALPARPRPMHLPSPALRHHPRSTPRPAYPPPTRPMPRPRPAPPHAPPGPRPAPPPAHAPPRPAKSAPREVRTSGTPARSSCSTKAPADCPGSGSHFPWARVVPLWPRGEKPDSGVPQPPPQEHAAQAATHQGTEDGPHVFLSESRLSFDQPSKVVTGGRGWAGRSGETGEAQLEESGCRPLRPRGHGAGRRQ